MFTTQQHKHNTLEELQRLIEVAQSVQGGYDRPKVSQAAVMACRTALDIVLPAMVMHDDARVRALAVQAWDVTRDLNKRAMARLALYLEENPL